VQSARQAPPPAPLPPAPPLPFAPPDPVALAPPPPVALAPPGPPVQVPLQLQLHTRVEPFWVQTQEYAGSSPPPHSWPTAKPAHDVPSPGGEIGSGHCVRPVPPVLLVFAPPVPLAPVPPAPVPLPLLELHAVVWESATTAAPETRRKKKFFLEAMSQG